MYSFLIGYGVNIYFLLIGYGVNIYFFSGTNQRRQDEDRRVGESIEGASCHRFHLLCQKFLAFPHHLQG